VTAGVEILFAWIKMQLLQFTIMIKIILKVDWQKHRLVCPMQHCQSLSRIKLEEEEERNRFGGLQKRAESFEKCLKFTKREMKREEFFNLIDRK